MKNLECQWNAQSLSLLFDVGSQQVCTEQHLASLPAAFDFLNEHATLFDQFEEGNRIDERFDLVEYFFDWLYFHEASLRERGLYEGVLQNCRDFIERLVSFEWDLTQETGRLFYAIKLLDCCIAKGIVEDMSPNYQQQILRSFSGMSDRDCAMVIMLFKDSHEPINYISALAPMLQELYPLSELQLRWTRLKERYAELGERPSPHYKGRLEWELEDSKPLIFP